MGLITDVVKEVGKKFEKTPGLGYVALTVSAVLATVFKSADGASDRSIGLYALAIALGAYWCGGFMDDVVFEPLYGLRSGEANRPVVRSMRRWFVAPIRAVLARSALAIGVADARRNAALKFHPTNQLGVYKTAKKLLSKTDAWEGRIKLSLDLSKAARTFVIPSVLLMLWEIVEGMVGFPGPEFLRRQESTAWLGQPLGSGSVAIVSTVIYVNLRLRHMRLLYEALAVAPTFSFQVSVPGSRTMETLWSVGDMVIAESQIPVCTGPAKSSQARNVL